MRKSSGRGAKNSTYSLTVAPPDVKAGWWNGTSPVIDKDAHIGLLEEENARLRKLAYRGMSMGQYSREFAEDCRDVLHPNFKEEKNE